jgi:hypothetical protein
MAFLLTVFLYFAVPLPGAELWYDRVVGANDLEGPHGGHRQRKPHRCCAQVGKNFSVYLLLANMHVYNTNFNFDNQEVLLN